MWADTGYAGAIHVWEVELEERPYTSDELWLIAQSGLYDRVKLSWRVLGEEGEHGENTSP